MIRKLRLKLILVVPGALILIFGAVFLTLNLSVYNASDKEAERFMQMIVDNDGFLSPRVIGYSANQDYEPSYPPDVNPTALRTRRFFYVKIDNQGTVFESNYDMMYDFSEANASEYIENALTSGRRSGTIGNFSYLIGEKGYGQIAVFSERSVEMGLLASLTKTSLVVAGVSCVLLFGLSLLLSKWMIAPVANAFEKQRRFVSDANHELKTPPTIISANMDVLQSEIGTNSRIEHIKTQLERMSKLIHDLLTLSRTEDVAIKTTYSKFDLSKAVLNTALEFESRAFEEGKSYEYEVQENVSYSGDEDRCKQLLAILIDNAIQHSCKNGKIRVVLEEKSGRPFLSVYNTGTGIPDAEKDRVFDRFYRSDDSRTRETGGYGLGLSIAKAIVDSHKGKIRVTGEYGKWVEFAVTL